MHIVANPLVLASCDFILVTVKGHDTVHVARQLTSVIRHDAVVVSFQNGVGNSEILHRALGEHAVLPGMVPFNVLRKSEAHLHQGTSGILAMQALPDGRHVPLVEALEKAGLPTARVRRHARRAVGQAAREPEQLDQRAVGAAAEGAAGAAALSQDHGGVRARGAARAAARRHQAAGHLPGAPLPLSLVPTLMELPNGIFNMVAKKMVAIDPNARSSMWEDLQRGRKTEVDLLNGEIVRLGAQLDVPTPINQRIVDLVKEAENRGAPPSLPGGGAREARAPPVTAAADPSTTKRIAAFVAKYMPAVQKEARAARRTLRALMPTATEMVYDNWNGLVFGFVPGARVSDAISVALALSESRHVVLLARRAAAQIPRGSCAAGDRGCATSASTAAPPI